MFIRITISVSSMAELALFFFFPIIQLSNQMDQFLVLGKVPSKSFVVTDRQLFGVDGAFRSDMLFASQLMYALYSPCTCNLF